MGAGEVRRSQFWMVAGAAVALIFGLGAGSAYAYFTSNGSGSGVATVGSVQGITVLEATGTATNKLSPGTSGDLLIKINNPNTFPVTITALSGNGTVTGSGVGCTTTAVSVPSETSLSINVPPGNDNIVVPNGVSMGLGSDNGCQGSTFQVPISITVHQG